MKRKRSFIAVDIDAKIMAFTQRHIDKAGLSDYVSLHVGDSAAQDLPESAKPILALPQGLSSLIHPINTDTRNASSTFGGRH